MPNQPSKHFLPQPLLPENGVTGTFTNPSSVTFNKGVATAAASGKSSASGTTPSGGGSPVAGFTITDTSGNTFTVSTLKFLTGTVQQPFPGEANYQLPAASGDVSGTYPALTVVAIQGVSWALGTPSNAQVALYNTGLAQWTHVSVSGDATITNLGAVTNVAIQNQPIAVTVPSSGDLFQFIGGAWTPSPAAGSGSNVFLGTVTVIATSNIALTGTPTVDGVGLSAGSVILPIAQTNPVENVPWVVQGVALPFTHATFAPAGSVLAYGRLIFADQGTSTTGQLQAIWEMTTGGGPVVGADPIAWTRVTTSLQGGVVGKLPVANGGTGDATLANHGVMVGQGTAAVAVTAAGTSGQVLVGQGATLDPAFETVSGDATLANTGAVTLATVNSNVGTFGDGTHVAQFTVNAKGLVTGASSVSITNQGTVTTISGPVGISWATATTTPVGTWASETSGFVIGNMTGGAAAPTWGLITILGTVTVGVWNGTAIDVAHGGTGDTTLTAHGVLIGEGTAAVAATIAGTAGQLLVGQGASADPIFKTISGDATITSAGAVTVKGITETSGPTDLTIGTLTDGQYLKRSGSNLISDTPSSGTSSGFTAWSSATTYTVGQSIVFGSDGNLYRSLTATANHDPTTDGGTNWELWYLRSSITLNCGSGQRFAGTALTDPAGLQQALNFIKNAVGAASPSTATIVIQIANNGTFTIATGASTTSFTSNSQISIGTTLLYFSGTAGNSGKSCRITAVTGSGPYTYTADSGGGSTGLGSTPALNDVFTADYGYGTNPVSMQMPNIGPNVTIQGSTSTLTVPQMYATPSDGGAGGTLTATTYYIGLTYTWTAGGATQETQLGPIISFLATVNHKMNLAGITLPTGATSLNVYMSTSLNGALSTFHVQATTGTIAGGLVVSAFASATASPPAANPVVAAFPCALSWASTLTTPGINITNTPGFTLQNLYLYGNSNTNFTSSSVAAFGIYQANCSNSVLTNIVSSSFQSGFVADNNTYTTISTCQADNTASNNNGAGFHAENKSFINGTNQQCLNCSNFGFLVRNFSMMQASGGTNGSATINSGTFNCGTGYVASFMSAIRADIPITNGQQNWKATSTYSPALNTAGANNSWINQT